MVVLLAPVLDQFLHIGEGYTLIPIVGGFRVGPASMGDAVFQIVNLFIADRDRKWIDV